MKKGHHHGGFTLLEMLIALALTVAVGLVITMVFVQSNKIFSQQTSRINTGLSINKISIAMSDGVKMSSGVVAQYPTSGLAQYTTGSETIVMSVPSINGSGTVIDNTYDYLVYTKDAQKPYLFRKLIFPDVSSSRKSQNQVLLTNLSLISFKYLNDSGTQVSPSQATNIKYIINNNQQSEQSSASGHLVLRND